MGIKLGSKDLRICLLIFHPLSYDMIGQMHHRSFKLFSL